MPADNSTEAWRISPELQQPIPRSVRLTGIGIVYCLSAVAFFLFGVGLSYRVVHDEFRRQATNASLARRLVTEGLETQATVTHLFTGMGYVVNYQYSVDGRSYERGAFIAEAHWQSLQAGSPLAIRYLPSDPGHAYPDGDPPSSQNHWSIVLPMSGMILLFMFGFAAIFISPVLSQRRLLTRGQAARGIVTRCKEGGKGRRSGYFLYYDFSMPDGSQHQGKTFSGSQLAQGSSVTLLYDPSRPRRNAIYPVETVRIRVT
ncbi:MAG TPA: DUF3592 domain-containing protein [Terracidiphilus sp.]|jgi:hypothetical protein